jgi:hypothetical protein
MSPYFGQKKKVFKKYCKPCSRQRKLAKEATYLLPNFHKLFFI